MLRDTLGDGDGEGNLGLQGLLDTSGGKRRAARSLATELLSHLHIW